MELDKIIGYSKSIFTYLSASIVPMLLNLAVNPFVAMNMSPDDYAITGYYLSFTTLISPIIIFYLMHYYLKSYYRVSLEEQYKLKAIILKSLIYFSGFVSVLCLVAIYLYIKLFNAGSELPIFPYLALSVFAVPITGVYTFTLTELKISRNSKSYFKLSVAHGVISVLLVLLFVVIFKWGAFGKLLAPLICSIIFFVWIGWQNRDYLKVKFDREQFKTILKFCAPMAFSGVFGFFSNGYDRVLLETLGDYTQLGYYVVGVQMAGYVTVFSTSVSSTFQPDIFQAISQKNYMKMARFTAMKLGVISMIIVAFIFCTPLIIRILTAGRYMQSVPYTQILALSVFFSTLHYTMEEITVAEGETGVILINKIVSTILIVLMFRSLIGNYGFNGAAWGNVISFAILFIVNVLLLVLYKNVKNTRAKR
ncbi:MAG: polysaccharide biosynthesis C-terminal domain-containing protein [Rikenellaceae bacterium]